MIINKTQVSFAGRVPSPRYIPVGVVGDNRVECVEFRLPTIADSQTATMLINCKFADAITLERTEDNLYCADITSQIAGESGNIEAYIRINGTDGAVWNSEKIILCVCNVPDISGKVEEQEPTALDKNLSAIAVHKEEMVQHTETMRDLTETATKSAESAVDAAKRAEEAAKSAEDKPGIPGKSAYQYAQDGGYAGTEEEFAAKLAQEIPEAYELPVATADTLGGVKVGKGLVMDGEALGVKPEGVYELIETIFVGYTLLVDKPEDWEINYGAYFEKASNGISPLKSATAWKPYTYYVTTDEAVSRVLRDQEPDGTPYHLSKVRIKFHISAGEGVENLNVQLNESGLVSHTIVGAINTGERYGYVWGYVENGYVFINASNSTTGQYSLLSANLPSYSRFWERGNEIFKVLFGVSNSKTIPVGSQIDIYGVRA